MYSFERTLIKAICVVVYHIVRSVHFYIFQLLKKTSFSVPDAARKLTVR